MAIEVGFGAPLEPEGHPTVFVWGMSDGKLGLYRSTDEGVTWECALQGRPMDYACGVICVNGDMNVFGQVYLGMAGTGFVYGELREPAEEA